MAKVPFSKLDAKVNNDICITNYCNTKGEEISYEVKKYLPIKDKLDLVTNIVNYSVDDNGFYNPMKVKVFMTLEIAYAYTNLNFTDKQKKDIFKLYDILTSSGIYNNIINCMDENEYMDVYSSVYDTIENIYKYRNSAMGILENITSDYSNLNLDAEQIHKNIADPENLTLLKNILDKLG